MDSHSPRNDRPIFQPLKTEVFWILLSLAETPRHGYGMLMWIEDSSSGQVRLGTGQLYRLLRRLLDDGWTDEAPLPEVEANTDPRRRYYRLTAAGRRHLGAECDRLERTVMLSRGLGLLSKDHK